jgi:hypothetical protein
MADDDLEKQIKSLSDKMEGLEESMRMVATPYSQLREYIERFQKISSSYFRLIEPPPRIPRSLGRGGIGASNILPGTGIRLLEKTVSY